MYIPTLIVINTIWKYLIEKKYSDGDLLFGCWYSSTYLLLYID